MSLAGRHLSHRVAAEYGTGGRFGWQSANANLTLSSSVETNMSREQMTALNSRQLAEGSQWTIESTAAIGAGDTQACYSSGSQPLYVMWPNEDSVENIKEKIEDVMR